MKKLPFIVLVALVALPLSATTWKNVSLMDAGCATKAKAMSNPDGHARSCALQCAKSGYGAVVDGKFVKFDQKGSDLAKDALQKSNKRDHLRATVNGDLKDGVIHVTSLKLD